MDKKVRICAAGRTEAGGSGGRDTAAGAKCRGDFSRISGENLGFSPGSACGGKTPFTNLV